MGFLPPPHTGDGANDEESGRLGLWAFLVILFLLSGWLSCRELKYAAWGRSANADVVRVNKYIDRRKYEFDEIPMADVRYQWTDADDGQRKDGVLLRAEDAPAEGDIIAIEYLPGVKDSRMTGDRNAWAIAFFAISFLAALLWFAKAWRDGSRPTRQKRKDRDWEEEDYTNPRDDAWRGLR
ncbi:MAG TPA: hypothetical protein P5081_01135 [Phycisphaerae bacterium]|nr:hypothetical protein [Phycisphaerae bacterium]HRW51457.1 hypothetical protein [Phycisphaerae bacterium]